MSFQAGAIEIGGAELFLLAGPCVIESEEHALKMATEISAICKKLGVPYVFKASFDKANRTSLSSYRGPGLKEGLRILASVKEKLGVDVVTDIHEAEQAAPVAEVVEILQIPAFLCRQTDLLVAAAKTGKAVNVKKGQFVAPSDMRHAVNKIIESGNTRVSLTERGTSFGYNNLVVDMRSLAIMRRYAPVIFDATHSVQLPSTGAQSGGQPEFIPLLSRAAVAAGVDGLFMEVHDNPSAAMSDGANAMALDKLEPLLKQLLAVRRAAQGDGMSKLAENVIRIEAEALRRLAERVSGPMAANFERAVAMLDACTTRVVLTGMGKSGLIARKIAATLSSTGTPAFFLHPAEALHGDLGMVTRGDVVIALSSSGETRELLDLLPTIKRLGVTLISMTCDELYDAKNTRPSTLAQAADLALDCSIDKEACTLNLAPTASTTAMLALGDALAVELSVRRGFKEEDFAELHPGGKLGKRLTRVEALMHIGAQLPLVGAKASMDEVIAEMSRKTLGIALVVGEEKLLGVFSDGDLRRQLERRGRELLSLTAEECMTRAPRTIAPTAFAQEALDLMEQKHITALPVVDAAGKLLGLVHLHDLWGTEMV